MKKNLTALFLVLLYGIALIKPAMPLIDYYTKLDSYLELCINKDRPVLQCNGQCVLMQKLNAMNWEGSNNPAPPSPVKVNLQEYPIGIIEVDHPDTANRLSEHKAFASEKHTIPVTYHSDIFHPPC